MKQAIDTFTVDMFTDMQDLKELNPKRIGA